MTDNNPAASSVSAGAPDKAEAEFLSLPWWRKALVLIADPFLADWSDQIELRELRKRAQAASAGPSMAARERAAALQERVGAMVQAYAEEAVIIDTAVLERLVSAGAGQVPADTIEKARRDVIVVRAHLKRMAQPLAHRALDRIDAVLAAVDAQEPGT